MNFFVIIATAVLFGLVNSDDKFGKKCTYKSDCDETSLGIGDLVCVDGFCQCKDREFMYDKRLKPRCGGLFSTFNFLQKRCNSTSCEENEECSIVIPRPKCKCKEGFIYIDKKCIKISYVKALERCYISNSGEALACDVNEHSICASEKCICFETFYPNTTSGKCEPMAAYVKSNNLTEYRARPGEYCREESHCISGLRCQSYECQCPSPCVYDKEKEICDCGPIEWPSIKAPLILGIILGLGILGFWAFMIKRTIKKHVKKNTSTFVNLERIQTSPERTASFALCPATRSGTASPAPPIGLSFPASAEGQAPVPNDTLPYKLGADTSNGCPPPPPPQASLYGINDPYSTTPSAPPNYSVTPSATDIAPPPYSPYPVNSGEIPHPTNPVVPDPSLANQGGLPYPLNPNGPSTDIPRKE